MKIKKVTLNQPTEDQKKMGATPGFMVTTDEEDMAMFVPADPANRHYWDVRDWYNRRKNPGFEFAFKDVAEAKKEPANRDSGKHIALTAEQTEDADLPAINLTQSQQREIRAARK